MLILILFTACIVSIFGGLITGKYALFADIAVYPLLSCVLLGIINLFLPITNYYTKTDTYKLIKINEISGDYIIKSDDFDEFGIVYYLKNNRIKKKCLIQDPTLIKQSDVPKLEIIKYYYKFKIFNFIFLHPSQYYVVYLNKL